MSNNSDPINTDDSRTNLDWEPLVERLQLDWQPEAFFSHFSKAPFCLFLDSAQDASKHSQFSFLAIDPVDTLILTKSEPTAFAQLEQKVKLFHAQTVPDLPPFQGGLAGLFSYDLAHQIESIENSHFDEFNTPVLAVGVYDVVLAYDHQQAEGWIISHGYPETDPELRKQRAQDRLQQMKAWLAGKPVPQKSPGVLSDLEPEELSPQFPINSFPGLTSNFKEEAYLEAVQRCIDYIYSGDIFQVNLSQRLLHPADLDSPALYLRLRDRNPAPFAGYFDLGDFQIVSASPERFLYVRDNEVETRPIKGTRFRGGLPEADLFMGSELQENEKDRAENIMIVDLLRNDISKVCDPESVFVNQLCEIENYQYVQHLVSSVTGKLETDKTVLDLLAGAFPGGSITGAPKPRAMEIIAELEPTARGPYCGSLGYIGFDGTMDSNILIRTITAGRGWWQAQVGGGIVAQSTPQREYEETWEKAEGVLKAFQD